MKKLCVIVLFLLVVNFGFVIAADEPTVAIGEKDVEEFQGIIGQLPFDEGGETNFSKYKPFKTRAEERIDSINLWLDENAGWMKYIFQMRPQVSFLFALNIYFILFFFLILFLNARGMWFFIEKEIQARLFGLCVFVAFGAIGLYAGLAYVVNNFLIYIWNILLKTAIWMSITAVIIFGFLLLLAYPAAMAILGHIITYLERKKAFKEKLKLAASGEAIDALIKEATKKP